MHSNNLLCFNVGFIRRKHSTLLCAYECAHKVGAGLDNARKSRGAMKRSCRLGLFRVKQMVAASWANNMRQLLLVVVGACVRYVGRV